MINYFQIHNDLGLLRLNTADPGLLAKIQRIQEEVRKAEEWQQQYINQMQHKENTIMHLTEALSQYQKSNAVG